MAPGLSGGIHRPGQLLHPSTPRRVRMPYVDERCFLVKSTFLRAREPVLCTDRHQALQTFDRLGNNTKKTDRSLISTVAIGIERGGFGVSIIPSKHKVSNVSQSYS